MFKKHPSLQLRLLFMLLAITLLWGVKGDLLFRMQELSLFPQHVAGRSFITEPGLLLGYIGAFLTQSCFHPFLGAMLLMCFLVLSQIIISQAFFEGNEKRGLSYLPSVFMLLSITSMDYTLYTVRSYGLLFSQLLGLVMAAGFFFLFKKRVTPHAAPLVFALWMIIGYPLLGFYAFLGALYALVWVWVCGDRKRKGWCSALFVVLAVCLPLATQKGGYAWLAGLPYHENISNEKLFIPLGLALLVPIAFLFLKQPTKGRGFWTWAATVAAVAMLFAGTFWDRNFHVQLKMERAIDQDRWEHVLRASQRTKEPTRIIQLYRTIALFYLNQLPDKLFEKVYESVPVGGGLPVSATHICAPTVFFHTGLFNYCRRWCMELGATYQKNVSQYKYLAKVALFTGQDAEALKYLDIIDTQLFQKKWVRQFRAYLNDKTLLADDTQYKALKPLQAYDGQLFVYSDVAEWAIYAHYETLAPANEALLNMEMACALLTKAEARFMDLFFVYAQSHPGHVLPTTFAQAAILFSGLNPGYDKTAQVLEMVHKGTAVFSQYGQFANMLNTADDLDNPAIKARFKERFGDTYWYYYFYAPIDNMD